MSAASELFLLLKKGGENWNWRNIFFTLFSLARLGAGGDSFDILKIPPLLAEVIDHFEGWPGEGYRMSSENLSFIFHY